MPQQRSKIPHVATKTWLSQINNTFILLLSAIYAYICFLMCLFSTHCVLRMELGIEQCHVSNLEAGIMEWAGRMHRQRGLASL